MVGFVVVVVVDAAVVVYLFFTFLFVRGGRDRMPQYSTHVWVRGSFGDSGLSFHRGFLESNSGHRASMANAFTS